MSLDRPLDLLLNLVAIFCVVSFNFMKLTPFSWLRSHNVRIWEWRRMDVMQVDNLSSDMFTTSVERREALHCLSNSLERNFVLDERGLFVLLWMV